MQSSFALCGSDSSEYLVARFLLKRALYHAILKSAHNSPVGNIIALLSEVLVKKLTNLTKGLFGLGRVDVAIILSM